MRVTETVSRRAEARFKLGQNRSASLIRETRNGEETIRLQLGATFHRFSEQELRDLQEALGQALEATA